MYVWLWFLFVWRDVLFNYVCIHAWMYVFVYVRHDTRKCVSIRICMRVYVAYACVCMCYICYACLLYMLFMSWCVCVCVCVWCVWCRADRTYTWCVHRYRDIALNVICKEPKSGLKVVGEIQVRACACACACACWCTCACACVSVCVCVCVCV